MIYMDNADPNPKSQPQWQPTSVSMAPFHHRSTSNSHHGFPSIAFRAISMGLLHS